MNRASTETDLIKFHASFNVTDLASSIEFYRLLFGSEPAKRHADYAKFELDEPPLVLSLIPGRPGAGGNLNHAGLRVRNPEELVQIQHRLEAAGIRTQREEGVECCHSQQTKFWVTDPDRVFWEIYILHEDNVEHDRAEGSFVETVDTIATAIAKPKVVWEHRMTDPIPLRIPYDDNSVHEVSFEGTANLKPESPNLAVLFTEAFRVLRPGGEIRLHGLTGDASLSVPLPKLPGPAAAVEHVPSHVEPLQKLRGVGFVDVRLEKLSHTAQFNVGGVPLREILIVARKPGHRPKTSNHAAIYLGPFAQTTDDFGNVFQRGELKALNIHDWQMLSKGAAANQFLLLAPKAAVANNS